VTAKAEAPVSDRSAAAPLLDRMLAALPLPTIFVWLCLLFGWQAWHHVSPWLFSDELQYTQLARSIAETGHPARRGQSYPLASLWTWITAPAWLIDDNTTAYGAVKAIGVLVMSSVVFPTYLLAREVVAKPWALLAAAAAGAIPSMAYSSMIIQEPLAYPYSTLVLYLGFKALVTRRTGWIVAAAAGASIGPAVRGELGILPVILLAAAFLLVATGDWARGHYATWSWWDRVGASVLFLGALIALDEFVGKHSMRWDITTRVYKGRMFDLGLQAGTVFTIGIGVLPVVAGLAAGLSLRGMGRREDRAFLALFWSGVACFATYTAVKAAFLSTIFATNVEERNLFYAAPLLLIATALWFDRSRSQVLALGAAGGFVLFLLIRKPYPLQFPYFEAPGNGLLALANREWSWGNDYARFVLEWVLLVAVVVAALPVLLRLLGDRTPRWVGLASRGVAVTGVLSALAWSLGGQIYTASGFSDFSRSLYDTLPKPVDWVDRAGRGEAVTYMGQQLGGDANRIYLTEFWNRSIRNVWSIDGSAPGPGPSLTPDLGNTDGTLWPAPGTPLALEDRGVHLAGPTIDKGGSLRLVRINGVLRLRDVAVGVFPDGWMVEHASYSRFPAAGTAPGTLKIVLSRAGFCHKGPKAKIVVRLGTLVIGQDKHAAIGRVLQTRRVALANCAEQELQLRTPKPPFQVDLQLHGTVRPSDYGVPDSRDLGAVVGFAYRRDRNAATSTAKR
jgi:hypothetical protein